MRTYTLADTFGADVVSDSCLVGWGRRMQWLTINKGNAFLNHKPIFLDSLLDISDSPQVRNQPFEGSRFSKQSGMLSCVHTCLYGSVYFTYRHLSSAIPHSLTAFLEASTWQGRNRNSCSCPELFVITSFIQSSVGRKGDLKQGSEYKWFSKGKH